MGSKKRRKAILAAQQPAKKTVKPARPVFFWLLIIVFLTGVSLRIYNLNQKMDSSLDERMYTNQAGIISELGVEGIRSIIKEHNSDEKFWIFPPPTRIGYLGMLALVMKITERTDDRVGAYISVFFSICSLLLLILLGLRFFTPVSTLFALLFLSVSPIDLVVSRRTWIDALFGFIGAAMVYCCCEITSNINRRTWYILLIILGSYYLLVKELALFVYGLCLIWVLWNFWVKKKAFSEAVLFLACSFIAALFCFFILVWAAGGITPIIEAIRHLTGTPNRYATVLQSGHWFDFLRGFWTISPLSTFLFIIGIFAVFISNTKTLKSRQNILGVILFTVAFLVFLLSIPSSRNFRYVSLLYVPFYLVAGLGLWRVILSMKNIAKNFSFRIVSALIVVLVIFSAWRDYRFFQLKLSKYADIPVSLMVKHRDSAGIFRIIE